jgi:hypothetical protein
MDSASLCCYFIATLRLLASCVIVVQILRHAIVVDVGHYIMAASYGHISVVKELIEVRNADINARNDSGRTALRLARDNGKSDIAAYLVSHGGIIA